MFTGHRFNQAQLRAFAVRCYAWALTVYAHEGAPLGRLAASWSRLGGDGKALNDDRDGVRTGDRGDTGGTTNAGWSRAKEHLHFALGRQVAHAGEMTGAGRYFRELLTCAERQPAAAQATYLKEYLFVCQRAMETAEGVPAGVRTRRRRARGTDAVGFGVVRLERDDAGGAEGRGVRGGGGD